MIRVVIVDDSLVFRSLIRRIVEKNAEVKVVESATDGHGALESIDKHRPDVVTLDIDMPTMDGMEVLKEINKRKSQDSYYESLKILMVSGMSQASADLTLRCLQLGANDFIAKPVKEAGEYQDEWFEKELTDKVLTFGRHAVTMPQAVDVACGFENKIEPGSLAPEVVLIGSSTGGPEALHKLLPELCEHLNQPMLVVQHMPAYFTKSLASNLDLDCRHSVVEGEHGQEVAQGHVYIAPGDQHMTVFVEEGRREIRLNRQPRENHCRPAVDVLFRSAAQVYAHGALVLLLTGMGSDGTKGLRVLKRKGASVIVQDEESSVVWGMPGNAVKAELVDAVYPIDEMAAAIAELCSSSE